MLMKQLTGGTVGGGAINPTLLDHYTGVRATSTMKTFTVDASKRYILVLVLRYNDTTYRTNTYYVANGTLSDLSNNSGATDLVVTLSGTSLSVKGGSAASYYCDISLIQLD